MPFSDYRTALVTGRPPVSGARLPSDSARKASKYTPSPATATHWPTSRPGQVPWHTYWISETLLRSKPCWQASKLTCRQQRRCLAGRQHSDSRRERHRRAGGHQPSRGAAPFEADPTGNGRAQ